MIWLECRYSSPTATWPEPSPAGRIQAGIAGPDPCAAARSKKRISAATRATPHAFCPSFPGCRCDSCRGKTSCSIHAGGRSGGGGGGGHLVTDEHLLLRRHAQPAGGGGRARPAGGGGGVAVGAEEGAVQAAVVAPGGGGGSRWGRTALASESSTADFLSRWKHFRKSECSVLCRIRIGASS